MKYLLGIGASVSKKYKKDPHLRVYIDNQFIDEYKVEDDTLRHDCWYCDPLHWIYDWKKNWIYYTGKVQEIKNKKYRKLFDPYFDPGAYFPRKFKFYFLHEDKLKNAKQISLHVVNDDSNYTNGFITKSTLLDLSKIFLIPLHYLKFFDRKECHEVRQEFNANIVPEIYNNDKDNNEKNLMVVNGLHTLPNEKFYREGYPFAMKYSWNQKQVDNLYHLGGSGILRIDLNKNEYGFVMLDQSYDELFQNYKNGKLYGFPISERFFNMTSKIKLDKYH